MESDAPARGQERCSRCGLPVRVSEHDSRMRSEPSVEVRQGLCCCPLESEEWAYSLQTGQWRRVKVDKSLAVAAPEPRRVTKTAIRPRPRRQKGSDLFVSLCGFSTCSLTALALWWIEDTYGHALYTYTVSDFIPLGAVLSGFVAASGYFAGAWWTGRRPTGLLLSNMILASVATFFLVYYLSYATLRVEGVQVSDYLSFEEYFDLALRSASMESISGAVRTKPSVPLGLAGYLVAMLQICGFAVGGIWTYLTLEANPLCARCGEYFYRTRIQCRYTSDADGMGKVANEVVEALQAGRISEAIANQSGFGSRSLRKGDYIRSMVTILHCKSCDERDVSFTVAVGGGDYWSDVTKLSARARTSESPNI